ncbi:flagellar hook capping FlgD N-terminal domain-containing protein [Maridesulfovibrio sp.]|uniref:flagellar hook assembly protein FlgD n=1 Tax=Maridesulfovibrio sp. TaxID=2795000 RepID=UPI002A189177|nr:flagellar hook capping FlgD N-terminal domain-containing protein [Maridesulfovibrio sp.]
MTIEGVSTYTATDSTSTSTTTSSSSSTLDQVDFLTLLTTQLEYQDPTNPVDNTEMINQMTNYSMLEQDVAQNENLETIINQLSALSALSTSGYIGQDVMAEGGVIEVEDGEATDITVELDEDAATLGINIYDSDGNIVDTIYFTDIESGETEITGAQIMAKADIDSDGTYTAAVVAYDENGDSLDVTVKSAGTITAVEQDDSGNTTLTLEDGREVDLTEVSFTS